jgi:hypothetical protein
VKLLVEMTPPEPFALAFHFAFRIPHSAFRCAFRVARFALPSYARRMSDPDFVICLNCETPTYQIEWENEKLVQAVCTVCGNDEPSEFMTESELEEQRG